MQATRTCVARAILILLLAQLAFLASWSQRAAPVAEADGPAEQCGTVMQSPVDIFPIVPCDTSAMFPTWMADDATIIGQRPLSQVVLPGAHDALTGLYNTPILQYAVQTQDFNMTALLDYGVRSFDLRFCIDLLAPANYYGCHGGFITPGVTPTTVIIEISAFTRAPGHEKEILILDWQTIPNEGSPQQVQALCGQFFDAFRDIIVAPTEDYADRTLNEIWAEPNHPRIVMRASKCNDYFNNDVDGSADRLLNWPSSEYSGGDWANSVFGAQSGADNCSRPNVQADYVCTDVAYVNTQDLTGGSITFCTAGSCQNVSRPVDPRSIHVVQALITAEFLGIYSATLGQWPAIRGNLQNLWNDNTNGARANFNVVLGDFVEHIQLVQFVRSLNNGPRIDVKFQKADGSTYVPGPDSWAGAVEVEVSCTPATGPYPADDLHIVMTGIPDRSPSSLLDSFTVSSGMTGGQFAADCDDTSGKIARSFFRDINIDPYQPDVSAAAWIPGPVYYTPGTWTNASVTVEFSCSDEIDPSSGIVVDTVTRQALVSDAGANQFVDASGSCADKAGNLAALPAAFGPIQIDKTAPAIGVSAMTADGHAYSPGVWTNQDVIVTVACTDQGTVQSGIASDSASKLTTVSTEGDNQFASLSGSCADNAGNAVNAPQSFGPILIDKTTPAIVVDAVTADGAAYSPGTWTNQAVTVTSYCADQGATQSRVASDNSASKTTLTTEGDNQFVPIGGSCVDNAGNAIATASGEFGPIRIDKTLPEIVAYAVSGGRAYSPGTWTNGDVSVVVSCGDLGAVQSGIATDTATGTTVVASEGSNQFLEINGICLDRAGNAAPAPARFGPLQIDKTAPLVTYSGAGKTYSILARIRITCDATDSLSGVATSTCAGLNGPGYTYPPGLTSLTATATDRAGNTGSGAAGFTVTVTYDDLCSLTRQMVKAAGKGYADRMCEHLKNAKRLASAGQRKSAQLAVRAYVCTLDAAAKARYISDGDVTILKRLAGAL